MRERLWPEWRRYLIFPIVCIPLVPHLPDCQQAERLSLVGNDQTDRDPVFVIDRDRFLQRIFSAAFRSSVRRNCRCGSRMLVLSANAVKTRVNRRSSSSHPENIAELRSIPFAIRDRLKMIFRKRQPKLGEF